ncbi:MAG: hypothetical protein RR317_04200 [Bilophila sp.]
MMRLFYSGVHNVDFRTTLMTTVLAGSLLCGGCGSSTLESTWKSTKTFYGEYINPPASIDYTEKGTLTDAETKLASRMVGIDIQLEQLERYLQNADRPPSGESIAILFDRFPWLSGLAAVNTEGNVLAQEPSIAMKTLDFARILEQKPRGTSLRGVRGLVEDTPLGAEILAGVPVYSNADLVGVLVTHFDMRSLLTYTSGAEDLVVLAPQGVLWSGRFALDATPLTGVDWATITKDATQGTVSNSNGTFIWMARFIGSQPLIFAAPSEGTFPENPEQLAALSKSSSFGMHNRLTSPVTESQVIENPESSILLSPLPKIRDLGPTEQAITN